MLDSPAWGSSDQVGASLGHKDVPPYSMTQVIEYERKTKPRAWFYDHKMSPKHLNRYVTEFAGRHNVRGMDTFVGAREKHPP